MTTVDLRTRFESEATDIDPGEFVRALAPELVEAHGADAGLGATRLGLAPLTLDVDGEVFTFTASTRGLDVTSGPDEALVVAMDRQAFADLVGDAASTFGLNMLGRATISRGSIDDFVAWEPVLRSLIDGRPVYEPGSLSFVGRDGSPLDLHRSFRIDDDPDDIGHFLAQAGYVHIESMFTEAEMAAVSADLDDAVAAAAFDDGQSWWARLDSGDWYAARILGFNQKSPALRELLVTERFRAISGLTDDEWVQRDPNIGDSAEGLLKKIGVVEGASDVSWHKDCSLGGHSRRCCGLTVGISVTGAGRENGELGAVAGSHRANVALLGIDGLDLPRVPLPTRTGDITVHCSCTLHMSRPPVSAERRVVYTGFGLAARPGDHRPERSQDAIRRERAALNDRVRAKQHSAPAGSRTASFDL